MIIVKFVLGGGKVNNVAWPENSHGKPRSSMSKTLVPSGEQTDLQNLPGTVPPSSDVKLTEV